jgi:hypothetical protein
MLSVVETLLIFVGIPLAVILIIAALVYSGGRKSAKRYRPGRSYDYASVWFTSTAHGAAADQHGAGTQAALPAGGHGDAEVPVASVPARGVPAAMPVSAPGVTGGASDHW